MQKKFIILLLLLFLGYQLGYTQNIGDTLIIEGEFYSGFNLSSTNRIKPTERNNWLESIKPISNKLNEIDHYLHALNEGDTLTANELVRKDSSVLQIRSFEGSYYYIMAKMNNLNILFKPLLQCDYFDRSEGFHLLSSTEKQLTSLEKSMAKNKPLKVKIVKIDYWEMDKTHVYKLLEILK
ncbi:MAG: hypothetical protein H6571_17955 [Lewinellaceae bacterium]|nr:hypothetical protein [Bacteroidota bacterium]MCB9325628.1 hypothetical protein [Lewinellaceae bacterium]